LYAGFEFSGTSQVAHCNSINFEALSALHGANCNPGIPARS